MKKQSSNKNVIAPEQKVKSLSDHVAEFLGEFGFQPYGQAGDTQVYHKTIAEATSNFLFLFVDGLRIKVRQGIRTGLKINGSLLYECTAENFTDILGLLSEQNYL